MRIKHFFEVFFDIEKIILTFASEMRTMNNNFWWRTCSFEL